MILSFPMLFPMLDLCHCLVQLAHFPINSPKKLFAVLASHDPLFPHACFDLGHCLEQLACFGEEVSEDWILLADQVEQHQSIEAVEARS